MIRRENMKTRFALLSGAVLFALYGYADISSAAPAISGASGNISHGETVTITGTDFGTKNPAPPLYWNDYESLTLDSYSALVAEAGFTSVETSSECATIHSAPGQDARIQAKNSSSFRWSGAPHPNSSKVIGGGYVDTQTTGNWCDRHNLEISAPSTPSKWYFSYYKRYSEDFYDCTEGHSQYPMAGNYVSNTSLNIQLAENINSSASTIRLTGDYQYLLYDSNGETGGDTLLIDNEKVRITPAGRSGDTITVYRGLVGMLDQSAITEAQTNIPIGVNRGMVAFSVGDVLTIDNEQVYVSQVRGSPNYDLIVTRGYNGTTAAAHARYALILNPATQASHTAGTRAYLRLNPIYNTKAAFGDWYVDDADEDLRAMWEPKDPHLEDYTTGSFWYFYPHPGGSLNPCYRCDTETDATNGKVTFTAAGGYVDISQEWKRMETLVNEGPQGWIKSSLNNVNAQDCSCETGERFSRWTHPYLDSEPHTRTSCSTTASIGSSDTTFPVNNSSGLQSGDLISFQFYPEVMRVTSVPDSTHIVVARGQEGTTPASYSSGRVIYEETTQGIKALRLGIYIDRVARNEFGWRPKHYCDQSWMYMDDVYADTTFSRVMLCNNQNFNTATVCEPQIPSAWNSGSIAMRINAGKLTDGQPAYLFVFDADNNHNESGYPVQLGGAQEPDTTPPAAPAGLVVR